MRQQVIQQDPPAGHTPPPSSNGRSSNNTHSRLSNGGSRNGNSSGTFDCTDEAVTSSSTSFYPTKTQIISRDGATLERITQVHISHIQHNNNTDSKG